MAGITKVKTTNDHCSEYHTATTWNTKYCMMTEIPWSHFIPYFEILDA